MAHVVPCEDLLTRIQQLVPVIREHTDRGECERHLMDSVAESRILRNQIKTRRVLLTDAITKRSQAMRCSGGDLGDAGSAFARTDERRSPSQTLGKVVFLSAIRPV